MNKRIEAIAALEEILERAREQRTEGHVRIDELAEVVRAAIDVAYPPDEDDDAELEARLAQASLGGIVESEDGRIGALIVRDTPELREAVKRWPACGVDLGEGPDSHVVCEDGTCVVLKQIVLEPRGVPFKAPLSPVFRDMIARGLVPGMFIRRESTT